VARPSARIGGRVAGEPATTAAGRPSASASGDRQQAAQSADRPQAAVSADRPQTPGPRLSKDAYRRQKALVEEDLAHLAQRKSHLEGALLDPSIVANFVEMRRVTSELADVDQALAAAEEAWLLVEERAP
jgi:hypothetical protein